MEKFDELLQELQALKIIQNGDWEEDLPEELYQKHFHLTDSYQEVDCGLDIDTHRWYELATTVIKIYDRFLGIRVINNVFSESMGYSDVFHDLEFFEMEAVQVTTYKNKK